MKYKIEHKIIEEKDYYAPIVIGFIWFIVCFAISYMFYFIMHSVAPEWDKLNIIVSTLFFCYGGYKGRGFFVPEITKEVIHIIHEKKN